MKHLYDKLQVLETEQNQMSKLQRLESMNRPLLAWYEEHARILPWREDNDPYRIWISEIMLQQTRVEAVKPYFERFMEELPTIEALANVSEERLLKLWEGLGYYNRARNLQKTAKIVSEQFDGIFPNRFDQLLSLPGIGSYTAGAIASIAYGIPVPAVDGNVLRVISRVLKSEEDILRQSVKRQMELDLTITMPKERASDFNQGLIEIGALVCIPNGQPKCDECPLLSICLAQKAGMTSKIPVKKPKKERRIEEKTVFLIETNENIALLKRNSQGLLASLYQLPNVEGHLKKEDVIKRLQLCPDQVAELEILPKAKHIFSHVEWHMIGFRIVLKEEIPVSYIVAEKSSLEQEYPLPNAFRTYMKLVK